MDKGIAVLGNVLVDVVKTIDFYPEKGMLTKISDVKTAVGGAVPNTLIDLAVIDPTVKLYAMGGIGDDPNGKFCDEVMKSYSIDTQKLVIKDAPTGFSDIMTVKSTGERTIFSTAGAGDVYNENDALSDMPDVSILHAAYITLLKALDECDDEYGTKLAKLLCEARQRGIKTSVDAVSSDNDKLAEKIIPVLKYCDYVIMNEIECCGAAKTASYDKDGNLCEDNLFKAMRYFIDCGVKEKVIIHCPRAGYVCTKDKNIVKCGAVNIPKGWKKGAVGAGDAFCAGTLYSIYKGWDDEKMLKFASGAGAWNLTEYDSISGMKNADEIWKITEEFGMIQ